MSGRRTVTVQTTSHGSVEVYEPAWCVGHAEDQPGHLVDLTHAGPISSLMVPTASGDVPLLAFGLEQRPYTELAPGTETFFNVEIGDDWYPHSIAEFMLLGSGLTVLGGRIRQAVRDMVGGA